MNIINSFDNFIINFIHSFGQIGLSEIGLILAIVVLDLALSCDNSLAINALAKELPDKMRNKAVWLGMGFAALLRLVALCFAAFIMTNPWVQILGGLYLIKLCYDHFMKSDDDSEHQPKKTLIGVLIAIGFLDLSLSLDNVIAVVAMTPNLAVIVLGVFLSIGMLATATMVTRFLMTKFPSLEDAAYLILAFLGVNMLISHGGEFLIWTRDLITSNSAIIEKLHLDIGEMGTIGGVGIIVAAAVIKDLLKQKKDRGTPKIVHRAGVGEF